MKNNSVLGIDIGYGYTKIFGDKFYRTFPSQVALSMSRNGFGTSDNVVSVNGKPYLVGDDIDRFGDFAVGREFVRSPEYLALLGRALMTVKTPCDVLVMGLPPSFYSQEAADELAGMISKADIRTGNGDPVPIPKTISYIPQGVGIFFDFINSSQQRNKQAQNGNILAVDIGHYTVDLVLFSRMAYQADIGRSQEIGVNLLYKNIKAHFQRKFGVFLNNDALVAKLIQEGRFDNFDHSYEMDVSAIVEEYINDHVIKAVKDFLAEVNASSTKTVDSAVFGGGGVRCVGQLLTQRVTVVDDPQMSNARGYYWYGKQKLDKQQADNADKPEKQAFAA